MLQPYPCQRELYKAALETTERYIVVCTNRRWGKDLHAFQIAIIQAVKEVCNVVYLLPKYKQASLVILTGKTAKGTRYVDLIPEEELKSINLTTRSIHFKNASQILLAGADDYDKLRGIGAKLFIVSEAAFCNLSIISDLILPIIDESQGKLLLISTASYKTHQFHKIIEKIKANTLKGKYVECTVENYIGHDNQRIISEETLELTRQNSVASTVSREYYCNPTVALEEAFFRNVMEQLKNGDRLREIKSQFKTCYVAFDLGSNTSLIIFNIKNNHLYILDNLNFHRQTLKEIILSLKEYLADNKLNVISLVLPHDARHFNKTGLNVMNEIREDFFFNFQVLDISKSVLIELQKMVLDFDYLYIDINAHSLIEALGYYSLEEIEKEGIIKEKAKESWATHRIDALRYAFNYYWLVNTRKNNKNLIRSY